MLLKGMHEKDGWVFVDYEATWKYDYDFMLDAAQTLIDLDFQDKLQRVSVTRYTGGDKDECVEEVKAAGNDLRAVETVADEHAVLRIAGVSRVMGTPVQLFFYDNSNVIRLCTPIKKIFEDKGDNAYTTYMCSMEIKAYCKAAERKAKSN